MRQLLKYPILLPSLLITLAVLLRVFLVWQGWVPTDGDEAIMNLAALHIGEGRDFPVSFYGQHYLGTLEAYIGALLFRIFGPSVLVMRVEMVGFYAAFLVVLYALTRRLYTHNFALVVLALLALGSPHVLELQGKAVGYPELPLLASMPFLVAFALEWSLRKKAMVYALWGILAGTAVWAHVLTGPYVLMAFSLLLLWRFREMLKVGLWAILVGVVIGAFPLIWYNMHASPGQDTLANVLQMTELGQTVVYNFWQHTMNTLFVSVPLMTGFASSCIDQGLSLNYPFLPTFHLHCIADQASWGFGYAVLMIVAGVMAIMGLRGPRRDHTEMIKQSTRLLLLLAALFTIILYIHGGAPVYTDVDGSRYLICAWVSLPTIMWPLWRVRWRSARFASFALIFLVLVLVHSTAMAMADMHNAQAEDARVVTLAHYLEKQHITRFYSEYWTCNRLIFYSQEKLICGNTDVTPHNRLVHGWDRYAIYRTNVEAAKDPAFVYPSANITVGVVEYDLKKKGVSYEVHEVAGNTVIVPRGSVKIA